MMGPEGGKGMEDLEMKGVVPRVVMKIFDHVDQADENLEFVVKVSFLEIYMEKIRDLLDKTKDNLRVREDPNKGVWVEGCTEVYCSCDEDVMNVLRVGQASRSVAYTNMNAESSRSHSICIITISQKNIKSGSSKSGRFYLVDLAGSEKVNKTGAKGQTLEEAKMINKSLTALGQVINALTDPKTKHIPYRDSKLTRLLQTSLGGNSRTTLCINSSISDYNYPETLSTLRFGQRAKSIKNKAKVNQERSVAELMALLAEADKEIAILKAYIALLIKEIRSVAPDHPIPPMPKVAKPQEKEEAPSSGKKPLPVSASAPAVAGAMGSPSVGSPLVSESEEGDELPQISPDGDIQKMMLHSDMKQMMNEKEESLRRDLEDKIQGLKDAQENLDSLRGEMERAVSNEEDLKKQNQYMVMKVAELELQKEQFSVEKEEAKVKIDQLSEHKASLTSQVDTLEKQLTTLQERLNAQEQILTKETLLSPSGKRRARARSVKAEGGEKGPAGTSEGTEKSIAELEETMEKLRKENQAILAEKMTLEAVLAAVKPDDQGAKKEVSVSSSSSIDPSAATVEEVITKYQKLEGQHRTLRQLTSQKFKEFESLKKSLIRDLQNRHEKVIDLEVMLDEAREQYESALLQSGTKAKSEKKVVFLEKSLEQLTQTHQKVMSQNHWLQAECEVSQKKIEARDKRVAQLEQNITNQQRRTDEHVSELQQELRELSEKLERLQEQNASLQIASSRAMTSGGNTRIVKPLRGGGGRRNPPQQTEEKPGFFGGFFRASSSASAPNVANN